MRKRMISSTPLRPPHPHEGWLDLEHLAEIEVTSEDPAYPVEAALLPDRQGGWRAAEPGVQTLRLRFDVPQALHHIHLRFTAAEERTQEFVLRYAADPQSALREIVRQQWTFSPQGATSEVEDYKVELPGVTALELSIVPDIRGGEARASLTEWRLA